MLDPKLETFLVVCREMNFTRAAQALHITQPAVSHQIRQLEDDYGVRLFSYQGKRLSLTPGGEALRQAAATMRHDALYLRQKLTALSDEAPHLRFGATLTIGEFVMPELLAAYLRAHPDTRPQMTVADTRALLALLDDGTIDFAVVEGYFSKALYDSIRFRAEPYLAVCAAGHTFSRPVRRIEDLLHERLLVREVGSGTREVLERYLAGRNLAVRDFAQVVEINSIHAIASLVRGDCGVSFLYRAAVSDALKAGALREIPLEAFSLTHDFSLIWRKGSVYAEEYRTVAGRLLQLETDGAALENRKDFVGETGENVG